MKRSALSSFVALAALCVVTGSSFAASTMKVSVKGTILDMKCYSALGAVNRHHGMTCGKTCLGKGLPAGILVKGHAWTLAVNPKLLKNYVGLKAEVMGSANPKTHVVIPTEIKVDEHGTYTKIDLK